MAVYAGDYLLTFMLSLYISDYILLYSVDELYSLRGLYLVATFDDTCPLPGPGSSQLVSELSSMLGIDGTQHT